MSGGHLAAHIRKMKPLYAERRAALLRGLGEQLPDNMALVGTDAGLHAGVVMPDADHEASALACARAMGLGCRPLSSFAVPGAPCDYWGLAFGFSSTDAATTFQLAAEFSTRQAKAGVS